MATDCDNENHGTEQKSFAAISQTRDAVLTLIRKGLKKDVRVCVPGGNYFLKEHLMSGLEIPVQKNIQPDMRGIRVKSRSFPAMFRHNFIEDKLLNLTYRKYELLEYDNMFCGVIIHVVWGKSVNTNKSGKDPGVPIGFHLIRSILEMSLFIHNFNMINPCTDTYETACQSQVFMLYPDPGKGFVPPECTGGCAGLPKSRNAQTMGLNSCRCTYLC